MGKPLSGRLFQNFEEKFERESPKMIISAKGGLELLHKFMEFNHSRTNTQIHRIQSF